jgi:transcriptional regulator with PAS, ATPase and Fis domain
MSDGQWLKEFSMAITVTDQSGKIIEMNDQAIKLFAKDGGKELIGKDVFECHPEPARKKLVEMTAGETINCYTTEKNGIKKMIYQAPWYQDQEFKGFVELSFAIPLDLPHFVRK